MAVHVALALALVGSLGLAALLAAHADRVAGARLLVLFLLGVAVWIVGNELPALAGPEAVPLALALLCAAPLTSAVFLHFAAAFTRTSLPSAVIGGAYLLGAGTGLVAAINGPGRFEPFAGLSLVAMPNGAGWAAGLVWAGLAVAGHLILLRAWTRLRGVERRAVAMVGASSAWGLVCMTGYAAAALRLDLYPWPLVGLPLYPVGLVYAVLRYRLFVANAWARRALVWTMLVAAAAGIVAALPLALPRGDVAALPWLQGALVGLAFVALSGPARRLAERLVYPGGLVSGADLQAWRAALRRADDAPSLAAEAAHILGERLRAPVAVAVGGAGAGPADAPRLVCRADSGGTWHTLAEGWEAAPPGPRRAADLFGAVLAEEAARLAQAEERARRERERAEAARLAELGRLAATVAHDIRNPLNIISMAAAEAPAEARAEIREQVARVARLAQDLLDYAKPWRVEPVPLDLGEEVRALARHYPGVELGPGLDRPLPARADPRRLRQALATLLDNAQAAAPEGARVAVEGEALGGGGARLSVLDQGPGVPEEARASLFQPFASRTPGGTGLGLAIVAKVAEAHGGGVELEERPGWSTCFTLTLPGEAAP